MEADQIQQEPEAIDQTQPTENLEEPKSEEVNESPTQQNPPEPENPVVETSEPDTESTEKTSEVEPDEVKPETSEEPVKQPEKEEEAKEVPQTAAEPENEVKPEDVEPKVKPENDEKPSASPEEKEEPAEQEKTEPPASEPAATNEVQAEPVQEEEKTEASKTLAEEKPAEEEQVQAEPSNKEEAQPKEATLPLFYGWFLLSDVEGRFKCSTMDFLKTLDTLEVFKKHLDEFTGEAGKEVDLEQYFQIAQTLHCTAKFCDYGKAEGAKEYAEQQVVKDSWDTVTELSIVGLIVTPRTFGARVTLTPEQMPLWGTGADKEGVPAAELPAVEALSAGSRAHVTLGCASGVELVQTGLDLLDILVVLQGEKEVVAVEEMELGTLSYLGQGRWYLSLREAVTCDATFSSLSDKEHQAEPPKKEGGEKKKKQKCTIL